jgi:hypothetical protein
MADRIESTRPMTQEAVIVAGGQSPAERRPRDLRTLRRIAAAISIVLAPLAVGVVRATVPLTSSSGGKGAIAAMAANPAMSRVELTAGVIATFFLPFAIVGLTRLVVRRAPVLAVLGGSLALVGWAMVPSLVTSDAITYEMARSGANSAQLAALWDQLNGNFAVSMLFTFFIVGHELGTLLLGIGLARARVVPVWAAAAVVIGIILHPVSFIVGIRAVDILAYALVTAGCVAAARAVLITPNDAWDLPPLSVHGAARTEVVVH